MVQWKPAAQRINALPPKKRGFTQAQSCATARERVKCTLDIASFGPKVTREYIVIAVFTGSLTLIP